MCCCSCCCWVHLSHSKQEIWDFSKASCICILCHSKTNSSFGCHLFQWVWICVPVIAYLVISMVITRICMLGCRSFDRNGALCECVCLLYRKYKDAWTFWFDVSHSSNVHFSWTLCANWQNNPQEILFHCAQSPHLRRIIHPIQHHFVSFIYVDILTLERNVRCLWSISDQSFEIVAWSLHRNERDNSLFSLS